MISTSKGPIYRRRWMVRLGETNNILWWDTLAEAEADAEKVADLHPGTPAFIYELTQVRIKHV